MSEFEQMYREVILDHNRSPRLFGKLEPADSSADGHNPLCGDRLHLTVRLEGDRVSDLRFEGKGCAISTASWPSAVACSMLFRAAADRWARCDLNISDRCSTSLDHWLSRATAASASSPA